jgi:hypothetical protein
MRPDRSYSRTLDLCCLVVHHSIPPTGGVAAPTPAVGYRRSLLTDLDTFFTKHHDCGDLDAGVNGDIVWMRCRCGANWPPEQTWDERARGYLELDTRGWGPARGHSSPCSCHTVHRAAGQHARPRGCTAIFAYCSLLCFTLARSGTLLVVPHPACLRAVVAIRVLAEIAERIPPGARRGRAG